MQIEKLVVEMEGEGLRIDLWDALRDAEAQRVHPLLMASSRPMETLLTGLDDIDPSFRVWVLAKRQSFHDRILRALEAGLKTASLDNANRRQLAEAIISLDPTHEEACRYVMQTRAEQGDLSGALRVYKTLWDILDDEYGMEPSVKTQQLVAAIKNGQFDDIVETAAANPALRNGARTAGAVEAAGQSRAFSRTAAKIAILVDPFSMNGVSADRAHLVHGFRHHFIACLTKFREWYVGDSAVSQPQSSAEKGAASRYSIAATKTDQAIKMLETLPGTGDAFCLANNIVRNYAKICSVANVEALARQAVANSRIGKSDPPLVESALRFTPRSQSSAATASAARSLRRATPEELTNFRRGLALPNYTAGKP